MAAAQANRGIRKICMKTLITIKTPPMQQLSLLSSPISSQFPPGALERIINNGSKHNLANFVARNLYPLLRVEDIAGTQATDRPLAYKDWPRASQPEAH